MIYNGTLVTLDNLRTVFSGFSVDIQDEIRSCILDGVDTSPLLSTLRDSPYEMQQMRLLLKEGHLPEVVRCYNGDQIRTVRRLLAKGVNLDPYSTLENGLPQGVYALVLSLLDAGAVIPGNLDFSRLRSEFYTLVKQGIVNNDPVTWMFNAPHWMSEKYAHLVTLLYRAGIIPAGDDGSEGVDGEMGLTIHSATESEWNLDVFECLLSAPNAHARTVAGCIAPDTDVDAVEECIELSKHRFRAIAEYVSLPGYQLAWIRQAFTEGYDWKPFTEEGLSNGQLSDLYFAQQAKGALRLHKRL